MSISYVPLAPEVSRSRGGEVLGYVSTTVAALFGVEIPSFFCGEGSRMGGEPCGPHNGDSTYVRQNKSVLPWVAVCVCVMFEAGSNSSPSWPGTVSVAKAGLEFMVFLCLSLLSELLLLVHF